MGELPGRRKAIILASCCLSLLIAAMDVTIVNVAIPTIRVEMHASASNMQWVVDIYTLTLAGLFLLAGGCADRYGRKQVFVIGLIVFAAGSVLCSFVPTIELLIAARLVQAVGGAMLNPVAMSIITQVFTGPQERARAIGIWGSVIGVALALGPILGGVLTELVGWRSVFLINVPVCIAAIALTIRYVPPSKSTLPTRFDPLGQILGVVFLFATAFVLIEGYSRGWTSTPILTAGAVAAAALLLFIRTERRHPSPFIDVSLFKRLSFTSALVIAVCGYASYGAFLFVMSLYLQDEQGYGPIRTGLLFLPMAVTAAVCSPLSGRFVGQRGNRPSLLIAGTGIAVSAIALTHLEATTPLWTLGLVFAVFGIGFGTVNAPITTTAVNAIPDERSSTAAAIASTGRQVGLSVGVALCGPLAGDAITHAAEFAPATHTLWTALAAFGATIVVLGVLSTTRGSQRKSHVDRPVPLINHTPAANPAH